MPVVPYNGMVNRYTGHFSHYPERSHADRTPRSHFLRNNSRGFAFILLERR